MAKRKGYEGPGTRSIAGTGAKRTPKKPGPAGAGERTKSFILFNSGTNGDAPKTTAFIHLPLIREAK
ncbi:MAG TPA: hypothetical protein VI112_01485 [Bacteroidia bacterium]